MVDSYHVHTETVARQGRSVQLAAFTILTVLAFSPVIAIGIGHVFRDPEKLATVQERRRYKARVGLLVMSALLMTLDVGFECGVAYKHRPVEHPAWWHHRAALYLSDYLLELLMVWVFAVARLDGRFKMHFKERLESRDGITEGTGSEVRRMDSGWTEGTEGTHSHGRHYDHEHGQEHERDRDHDGFWKEVHWGAQGLHHGAEGEGSRKRRFMDRINTDEDIFGSG